MSLNQSGDKPVRVLHVVTYMGRGGIETMIMNYYRQIDRSKVQFDFLVHRDFRADYDDEIEALGGKIYRLPPMVIWRRSYYKALNAFFAAHPEYRIVHAHLNCMSTVILKAAKKNGVSVRIAHSHAFGTRFLIRDYYRIRLPGVATQLFACGKLAGDWMFRGAKYRVIPNAIDVDRYVYNPEKRREMRASLGIPSDAFVVGHIGRLNYIKNHTFLLDVFEKVKEQKPESVLLFVGDGELRQELEKKAETLGLRDSVIFTGIRSDVPDLTQAMDSFAFPSLTEGLPVALVEAQAAGLPCLISTGVPSESAMIPEVRRLELSLGAAGWARHLLEWAELPRRDTREEIASAGYDIKTNVEYLQNYYLEQGKVKG